MLLSAGALAYELLFKFMLLNISTGGAFAGAADAEPMKSNAFATGFCC